MKINEKELIENGVEVDVPVWKDGKAITPQTICYDKNSEKFVLKVIKTGEISYAFDDLDDLLKVTNKIYDMDDEAVINCCLCGNEITEEKETGWRYGHNALPLKNGRCCNTCNFGKVIPARISKTIKGVVPK